ncbi:hypothetical protein BDW74DRAFT_184459 [Aspergillus multicolor]|uniref:fungal specific transcription factor domain-containing protein n=1 Tax=Aspergillus multicolor TaxID=41759 RepID=UPI003CCD8378
MSTILITGSSRGLGLELVRRFSAQAGKQGGLVIATARNCSPALKEAILQSNGSTVFVVLDLSDEKSVTKSAEEVRGILQGRSLDILINCAGAFSVTLGKTAEIVQDQQNCTKCTYHPICAWLQSDMGGENADLTVPEGAEAVMEIVVNLKPEDNGCFKSIRVPGWDGDYLVPIALMLVRNANACGRGGPLEKGHCQNLRGPVSRIRSPGVYHQRTRETSPMTPSTEGDNASNYHAIQAKNIIQLELDDSRFNQERQDILRSALQLVTEIAATERHQADTAVDDPLDDAHDVPESPPREMLFMLLRGPTESVGNEWPDHISDSAYERMATALLEGDLDPNGRLFHQYSICAYVKAVFRSFRLYRATENQAIRRQLSQSKKLYTRAAVKSIRQFNPLQWPDLVSIQSLVSSALLMQHLGRFNQCWLVISYAARQITALNYHKIHKSQTYTEIEEEIYSAVCWCYYLDRTLSSLLGRPVSLPELEVSPVDLITLDPSSPYGGVFRTVLELAVIQGELHRVSNSKSNEPKAVVETCQALETKMLSMLPTLQANRDALSKIVQYDWASFDFCYYAIFVEVQRTRLKSFFTPLIHRQCLLNARKCLQAFRFLQQHQHPVEPSIGDPYPSFLTCAFFVVFCHIIGTLDRNDYNLMRSITESLSQFKQDPHLGKLLGLLQSLERMCEPLFVERDTDVQQEAGTSVTSATNDHTTANVMAPVNAVPQVNYGGGGPDINLLNNESMQFPSTGIDFSAEGLMWQLFNSEVPAGWLTADMYSFHG